jgi:hypothetical protein
MGCLESKHPRGAAPSIESVPEAPQQPKAAQAAAAQAAAPEEPKPESNGELESNGSRGQAAWLIRSSLGEAGAARHYMCTQRASSPSTRRLCVLCLAASRGGVLHGPSGAGGAAHMRKKWHHPLSEEGWGGHSNSEIDHVCVGVPTRRGMVSLDKFWGPGCNTTLPLYLLPPTQDGNRGAQRTLARLRERPTTRWTRRSTRLTPLSRVTVAAVPAVRGGFIFRATRRT